MTSSSQPTWSQLRAADGHCFDAFEARPEEPSRGSVVVLQEIFGVNRHIQSVALRLTQAGYRGIAPALFDRQRRKVELGYDAAGIEDGKTLMVATQLDTALQDVAAAVAYAAEQGPVAVLGFCWGGTLAWLAASRLPVTAAVAYYGGGIGKLLDQPPHTPALLHFGEKDASIPLEVAQTVRREYPQLFNHVYPASHGFNCEERASYDGPCAEQAWFRTLGFLAAAF